MPPIRTLLAIALVSSLLGARSGAQTAAAASDAPPASKRPKVALVLSGGGARGFAHVGVLRALKDLRVPVDMVVGVSMGAVVGGAYASGRSVEELEAFVQSTDWTTLISDRAPRAELDFRRREEDVVVPSRIELSLGTGGLSLPLSVAGNQTLESTLLRLLPENAAEQPVDRLPLPFRTVASDLLTGELVDLRQTPLFQSVRASLSVPGVFAPVRVDGRLVVDGGLVRNLPVDQARAMGADVLIAVNVGTPLAKESEITSAFGVAQQMLQILTEQNVQRSLRELRPEDVLIAPKLDGISFLDFSRARSDAAIAAGNAAVQLQAVRLQALSVSAAEYAAFEAARTAVPAEDRSNLLLAKVTVQPTEHAGAEALANRMGLSAGPGITLGAVRRGAARLHGSGDFDRVLIDVRESGGTREAVVTPVESPWAHSRLRLGLEMTSDFEDDNRFTVSALHVVPWINRWGGELLTLARLGSNRLLATQLAQPLLPGSEWYLLPGAQYEASSSDIFVDGQRVARAAFTLTTASAAIGRHLSDWGDAQIGLLRRSGQAKFLLAPSGLGNGGRFTDTAAFAQLKFDTLDALAFPTRGGYFNARWEWGSRPSGGQAQQRSSVLGLRAFRAGDWAGHVYGEWARSTEGIAPEQLGGFLRLSGTERGSVDGNTVLLGRVVMARRIGEMPTGLGGDIRVGFSAELGGAFDPGQAIRWGRLKQAASAFVSVDTRFGPLYFAAGATRGQGSAIYLFLGPFW